MPTSHNSSHKPSSGANLPANPLSHVEPLLAYQKAAAHIAVLTVSKPAASKELQPADIKEVGAYSRWQPQ